MLRLLPFTLIVIILSACAANDSIFVLDPQQSMLMTGKGPGQDAAINPYNDSRSIAIVKSLNSGSFEVRVQAKGEIIEIVRVPGKGKVEVILEPGYELYLDTEMDAKAKVTFKAF